MKKLLNIYIYIMNWVIFASIAILSYITSVNGQNLKSPWYSEQYNSYSEFDPQLSYHDNDHHPCERECLAGQEQTCYYEFIVHYYEAASRICSLYRRHNANECIRSDGVRTDIMVVNRQLPGPNIIACENDTVVVDVINHLREDTTIHWHGLHMRDTPHMDGAPYTTQYPINPGESFRYKFYLKQHGSFWWHSHSRSQRAFGVAGPLIVKRPIEYEPHSYLYDYDLTEHIVFIEDWFYNFTLATPTNILVNGKGHNNLTQFPDGNSRNLVNYERFKVEQGQRYRFRVIYNGNANCPLQLSVDNHYLLVINSDSNDIEATSVKSIIILAAERYDFVIHASEPVDNYWMRIKALGFCATNQIQQAAIIQYKGASKHGLPRRRLSYTQVVRGLQLNPLDVGPSEDLNNLTLAEVNSLEYSEWSQNAEFQTYYTSLGIYNLNDQFAFEMDNIVYEEPSISLLQARYLDIEPLFCNKSSLAQQGIDCRNELCSCLNVIQVPANQNIEFVLTSETATGHPFHPHGIDFRVVGMGVVGLDDVTRIEEIDKANPLKRRLDRFPAIKDTVQVPGYGYTIIRFKSTNPGYWMFHCHLTVHSEQGMMSILKIGEHSQMVPTPLNNCYSDDEYRCDHRMK